MAERHPSSAMVAVVAEALEANAGQDGRPFDIGPAMARQWSLILEDRGIRPEEVLPALRTLMGESDRWQPVAKIAEKARQLRPPREAPKVETEEPEDPPMTRDEIRAYWDDRLAKAEAAGDIDRVRFAMAMVKNQVGKSDEDLAARAGGDDGRPEMRRVGE